MSAAAASAAGKSVGTAGSAELQHLADSKDAKQAGWDSTEISFPYVLEDPECDLYALNVWRNDQKAAGQPARKDIRILTIASGGDVALVMGAESDVGAVHAIDLNVGQIHACRLKRAAYERLPVDACIDFLLNTDPNVHGQATADEVKRRVSTLNELLPHVPADTKQFWSEASDAKRYAQLINGGLYSFGFRQRDLGPLTAALRAAGLHPYENTAAVKDEKNQAKWEECFRQNLMSKLPGQKVGPRIGNLLRAAICKSEQAGNHWFVRSFFGRPHPSALPHIFGRRSDFPVQTANNKFVDTSKVTFECTYRIVSYHVMSCHVMSCHVMSCHIMSCHVFTMDRH